MQEAMQLTPSFFFMKFAGGDGSWQNLVPGMEDVSYVRLTPRISRVQMRFDRPCSLSCSKICGEAHERKTFEQCIQQ